MTSLNLENQLMKLLEVNELDNALRLLDENPLLIDSPSIETAVGISFLLLRCNSFEECIVFSTSHLNNKASADLFYNLAFAYESIGNYLDAIRYYQCARLFSLDEVSRIDAHLKIQKLRYPNVDENTFAEILKYLEEQKLYVIDQLKSPTQLLEPKDYIKTEFPIIITKPRILYGTMEIANHISHYVTYFRNNGFDTFGLNYVPTYLNYNCDFSFSLEALSPEEFEAHYLMNAADLIGDYDVFHFIFNRTLIPNARDIIPLKVLNKKVFMHNMGSEIRIPELAQSYHPYWKYAKSYLEELDSEITKNNIMCLSQWINNCIVGDYESLSYVKDSYSKVHLIGVPIDLNEYKYCSVNDSKIIHIVHAPTNSTVKGSEYFENAVRELSKKYPIRYTRIERMKHEKAIEIYRDADIILDQLIIGSHGSLALECMAMGKCVVVYINPKFPTLHGEEIPVWNANIDNLYERLEQLVSSYDLRCELSLKARAYVEKYNDLNIIGAQLKEIYLND